MIVIGLTGGIASGKSTVCDFLKAYNIPICDTDYLARKVVQKDSVGLRNIVTHFGQSVLNSDGTLNRQQLSAIVFKDETKRNQLNAILHPLIFDEIDRFKHDNQHETIICIDMPLLFESHYHNQVDLIVVVFTTQQQQLERLMKRNQLTEHDALLRINAQLPLSEKVLKADVVIDNSKDLKTTQNQVEKFVTDVLNGIM